MSINTLARLKKNDRALDTRKLEQVWQNLDEYSCPFHYNFHLHTVCSDGQLTPESLIEQATQIGLQGLAITDHHSVKGFYRARDWLNKKAEFNPQQQLPYLWTGIEITSILNGTTVHILGYGFDPDCPQLQYYLRGYKPEEEKAEARIVINTLHKAGGLVVLAHPCRYRRGADDLITEANELGIDGVETYYAYGNPHPWQPTSAKTELVKQLGIKYNLYDTCGTDTHGNNIFVKL